MSDTSKIQELNARIDSLKDELAKKRSAANFFNTATLVIGLLLLALITTYFVYGYMQFEDITRPEMILKFGKAELESNLGKVRETMSDEIKRSAPGWAEELSNEFVKGMPNVREYFEQSITKVIDEQVATGQEITTQQFLAMIKDNREDFKEAMAVMSDRDDSQEFVNRIMPIMEKEYIPNMKFDAIQILGVLEDLNQRITKLAKGENLNPIEAQQRHILGLTRTIRLQELPQSPDDPAPEGGSN